MCFYRTKQNNVDPRLKREAAEKTKQKDRNIRVLIFSKTENRTEVKLSNQPTPELSDGIREQVIVCGTWIPREN